MFCLNNQKCIQTFTLQRLMCQHSTLILDMNEWKVCVSVNIVLPTNSSLVGCLTIEPSEFHNYVKCLTLVLKYHRICLISTASNAFIFTLQRLMYQHSTVC